MNFRSDRVALTARWAVPAAMLIGTVICVVSAATSDTDRPELQELLEQYAATGQGGETGGNPGAKAPGKEDKTADDLRAQRLAGRHMFTPAPKVAFSAKLQGVLGHLAYFVGNAQGMRVGQAIMGAKIKEIGPNWVKVDFQGKEMTVLVTGGAPKGEAPAGPPQASGPPGLSGPRPTGAKPAPGPTQVPVPAKNPTFRAMPGGGVISPAAIKKLGAPKGRVILNNGNLVIINDDKPAP